MAPSGRPKTPVLEEETSLPACVSNGRQTPQHTFAIWDGQSDWRQCWLQDALGGRDWATQLIHPTLSPLYGVCGDSSLVLGECGDQPNTRYRPRKWIITTANHEAVKVGLG